MNNFTYATEAMNFIVNSFKKKSENLRKQND